MTKTRALFEAVALQRTNLNEQIADNIQGMIESERLRAGERLPSERGLATLLNVNRATVREAIHILQQRGLVEMRAGSGAYVTQVTPEVVAGAISCYFASHKCSAEDLQAVRAVIEPEIAALAAIHATPADVKGLRARFKRLETAWGDGTSEAIATADSEFHLALAKTAHNALFFAIMNGLGMILTQRLRDRYDVRRDPSSPSYHRRVCDAVAAGDADAAREAMRHHMVVTVP
ncbi:MAG: hypothetical protein A3K19_26075 [Lentisphaerae bacterium RIFOXYB12_FULL_65_16]|nr:MAG: hypothetical protein A3K18_08690 [Lentisphaerae bacterium RIFOXYA12_64_32]OGV87736.1 MAG: hypothetical protein A3K19_26075 [Lentisphaerae bacterium RIFOXYB12_FULL_65_16]